MRLAYAVVLYVVIALGVATGEVLAKAVNLLWLVRMATGWSGL